MLFTYDIHSMMLQEGSKNHLTTLILYFFAAFPHLYILEINTNTN